MHDTNEPINNDPFTLPLDDAAVDEADLDAVLDAWLPAPDHRVLFQTRWMPIPKNEREDLTTSTAPHPMAYILYLQVTAARFHQLAADWETATTSTAARALWQQCGVRTIAETHPLIWLESTPLMRHLRQWQDEVENPETPRRATPKTAKTRYNDPDVDPFALP